MEGKMRIFVHKNTPGKYEKYVKYKDSKVWLRTSSGVVGWDLQDLNARIDEFNLFPWASEADFFDWLSWVEDDDNDYQGFSVLWYSILMKDVHRIRK